MKKLLSTILLFFLFSCEVLKDEPSTLGVIEIQKLNNVQEFAIPSPKKNATIAFVNWIDGTVNAEVTIKIYDETGTRFIIERTIPPGIYKYETREFRVDYYSAKDIIIRVIPTKGSEENFKLRWGII